MEGNNAGNYNALRDTAALVDLSSRGKIAVTGEDRVRWLHGMVTNDVKSLAPGSGCYCFMLDAQGHILADANVIAEPERLIVDCPPEFTDKLMTLFDRFIIMDQVEIAVITQEMGTLAVEGPSAGEALAAVDAAGLIRYPVPRGTWLMGPPDKLPQLNLPVASAEAYEVMRIESGLLRVGVDTDDSTIANETGCLRAMHFNKGCYVGQEIVERVRSRGHVNRIFTGFQSESEMPPQSTIDPPGRITSSAYSPGLQCYIALGYLRREHATPGTEVTIVGKQAKVRQLT